MFNLRASSQITHDVWNEVNVIYGTNEEVNYDNSAFQ